MNNEIKKTKKLNNKGFSLVELIIVIAIMAVLIGVLAPQYLRYVERSRVATDQDNIAAIESACQVWGSETDTTLTDLFTTGTHIYRLNRGSAPSDTDAQIVAAIANAGLPNNTQLQNRQGPAQVTITVDVAANGTITVSHTW